MKCRELPFYRMGAFWGGFCCSALLVVVTAGVVTIGRYRIPWLKFIPFSKRLGWLAELG